MSLPYYGLLTGKLEKHGPQHGGNPHYLLYVHAGGVLYRVAVNTESTSPAGDDPPELEWYMIPDLANAGGKAMALVRSIKNRNAFVLKAQDAGLPTLDYVRHGLFDANTAFSSLPIKSSNDYSKALVDAADRATGDAKSFLAVFGSGYSDNEQPRGPSGSPRRASIGFSGVENVHMNQGNFYRVGRHLNSHFFENGVNQDGAVLFYFSDGSVQAFFSKFKSQTINTDDYGNPRETGVQDLDAVTPKTRDIVAPPNKFAKILKRNVQATENISLPPTARAITGQPAVAAAPGGFVFANPTPKRARDGAFKPDDDSDVRNSPFVANFAKHGVPEPVPGPRGGAYPRMSLESVLGSAAVDKIKKAGQIVFHAVGDTGSPSGQSLPHETTVADLMVEDFQNPAPAERPQFFFHLGDVVYFFGQQEFYYDQFYQPYQDYSAPIFAIPGNHDGITFNSDMQSLAPFIKAFCDEQPSHWESAGGVSRTTMTQPGVFFTLDAPFVSIIGLYSNCSESYGYLDQQQKLFFYNELVRLKPLRESGEVTAVLLAVHHCPLSFSPKQAPSLSMLSDLDTACAKAGFAPDAVLSGHAHIYQRITRTTKVNGEQWEVPYIVAGSGGYADSPKQELEKQQFAELDTTDPQDKLHSFLPKYGYLRLIVTPADQTGGTLRIEFHSPDLNRGGVSDACVLDLNTHQLVFS
jgi:uncharacterized protein YukJ